MSTLMSTSRDKVVAGFSQPGSQVMKDVKGKDMALFALPFLSLRSHVYLSCVSSISLPFFFKLWLPQECNWVLILGTFFYLFLYFLFIPFSGEEILFICGYSHCSYAFEFISNNLKVFLGNVKCYALGRKDENLTKR